MELDGEGWPPLEENQGAWDVVARAPMAVTFTSLPRSRKDWVQTFLQCRDRRPGQEVAKCVDSSGELEGFCRGLVPGSSRRNALVWQRQNTNPLSPQVPPPDSGTASSRTATQGLSASAGSCLRS